MEQNPFPEGKKEKIRRETNIGIQEKRKKGK
jgi:hypothetical protein